MPFFLFKNENELVEWRKLLLQTAAALYCVQQQGQQQSCSQWCGLAYFSNYTMDDRSKESS